MKKQKMQPAILYLPPSEGGYEFNLPYIEVEKDSTMPTSLFICEHKQTGEVEPDSEGNECPIVDILIHHYVDLEILKKNLSSKEYDNLRVKLGLLPLKEAKKRGANILKNVDNNIKEQTTEEKSQSLDKSIDTLKQKLKKIKKGN